MKNTFKNILVSLFVLVLSVVMIPNCYAIDGDAIVEDNTEKDYVEGEQFTGSKEATDLDENFQSTVTITLPSEEDKLISDIVFVIDSSSCGGEAWAQANTMMNDLVNKLNSTEGTVKVGAVVFRGYAYSFDFVEVNKDNASDVMAQILAFAKDVEANRNQNKNELSGSNIHAGLVKAGELLSSDTSIPDSRKYVVLISDGITYTWLANDDQVGVYMESADDPGYKDGGSQIPSNSSYEISKGSLSYHPEDYEAYFNANEEEILDLINNYGTHYSRAGRAFVENYLKYKANMDTVDASLYMSWKEFLDLASKYNAYAVTLRNSQYGYYFMQFLNGGKTTDEIFAQLENDVLYLVGEGSILLDQIGEGQDNFGENYEFDTVLDTIDVTINGESLNKVEITTKDIADLDVDGIENIDYVLAFGDEENLLYIVMHFNDEYEFGEMVALYVCDHVSNFEHISLTFKVELVEGDFTNPGDHFVNTNGECVLIPTDSEGNERDIVELTVEDVKYTVEDAKGSIEEPEIEIVNTNVNGLNMGLLFLLIALLSSPVMIVKFNK